MAPRDVDVNGVQLAVWERPGIEPAIFLAHATGFHSHCWDAVTDHLVERSVAYDIRGHGASAPGEASWRQLADDAVAIVQAAGLKGAIGVGHSIGGHSLVLAAAKLPGAFAHLLLLEPVILPAGAYTGALEAPHFARKRRYQWDSPAAMAESFRSRPPFEDWDEQVLEDYCEHALVPSPDRGGYVLACHPDTEGTVYEGWRACDANPEQAVASLDVPVTVVRSARPPTIGPGGSMLGSATDPGLVGRFRNATELISDASHFIPMEQPEWVADQITRIAQGIRGER